jgi:hypothetical protein
MANKIKKYKQTEIPKITITDKKDLVKVVKEYYSANLQGKTVVNKDLEMTIHFTSIGKGELAYGKALHAKKVAVIKCLEKLMEVAEYNNFGERKETDKKNVVGFLNFKAKVEIDGVIENVRISVLLKKDGRAYYNHEVNIKK